MTGEEEPRAEFDLTGNFFVYNILYVVYRTFAFLEIYYLLSTPTTDLVALCIRVSTLMVSTVYFLYLQRNKDETTSRLD